MHAEGGHDLQLLVFELAFKLLGLGDLTDSLVEIVLVDSVTVVLDGEQTTVDECQHAC